MQAVRAVRLGCAQNIARYLLRGNCRLFVVRIKVITPRLYVFYLHYNHISLKKFCKALANKFDSDEMLSSGKEHYICILCALQCHLSRFFGGAAYIPQ